MATELIGSGISAGAGLAGQGMGAIAQGKENDRLENQETKDNIRNQAGAEAQVQELDKALATLTNTDYSGLQNVASQQIGAASKGLDASFALNNAGVTQSGVKEQMRGQMTGGILSNLASQINQDQLQRQMAVLATKGSQVYRDAYTPTNAKLTPEQKVGK
jgi:hypothetical protein